MFRQVFSLATLLLLAAGIGFELSAEKLIGSVIAIFLVSLIWTLLDQLKIKRILQWLKRFDGDERPSNVGVYSAIVDRVVRIYREQRSINAQSAQRLNDFLAAIQASPNGVLLLDSDSRIEWCNQTAAQQLGIDMSKDALQHIGNLVRDPLFSHFIKQQATLSDVVIQSRDSSPQAPKSISVQLFPYGEGRRLLLSRDITQIEQAEVMRRDFVANVSHEIRTPLTVLAGFVETMLNLPVSEEERRGYLELMSAQATRMQTLVNDLLTLSKLEGSPIPSQSEWTPIVVLCRQCLQEAESLSQLLYPSLKQSIQLECTQDAEEIEVSGSRNEIFSAMINLVSNAVRYTPEGGSIDLRLGISPSGELQFAVKDTGPGIAPEHIPRLTERFYRVDRSRSRDSGGTGLGLAIVKHVLQRHDAHLSISSQVGKGSCFSIRFPVHRMRVMESL
jgi:two-component system phosphate regulon sensor histidine kinase PhoR